MSLTRRQFMSRSSAVTAAVYATINIPSFAQEQKKIRFAQVGCGGRGKAHLGMCRDNNFVAACDSNEKTLSMFSEKTYPDLRKYSDWREMLEKEAGNIDAVVVATPDHTHYPVAMTAMMLGKAVFCEKPVAWSVKECLDLAEYAEKKKIPTQMGNQGNAGVGWRKIYSIVHSDVIGKVSRVETWTNRPIWPQGNPRPTESFPVPPDLNWEAWIGAAPMRPYHPEIQPFKWRGYYDFGCGALGDMACHTMNAMFQVMKPEHDLTVEPILVEGRSPDGDKFPKSQIIKWTFAKSGECPGFDGVWYDGGKKPEKPEALGVNELPNTGSMFVGSKGVLISSNDYNDNPVIYVDGQIIDPKYEMIVKESPGMHQEFQKAVLGEESWDFPKSRFAYAGKITSIINMGTIAEKLDKKLTFNAKTMKFDDDKANALMSRKPREGWEKPYKV